MNKKTIEFAKIQYTFKNLQNLLFTSGMLFVIALFFLARLIYEISRRTSISNYSFTIALAMFLAITAMGIFHIRLYQKESKVVGVSEEGLHFKSGSILYFKDGKSFRPIGVVFHIKFLSGYNYSPTYLDAKNAEVIFKMTKQYIETSARREEIIKNIDSDLKKQHNQSAYLILILSSLMMVFPFLPFMDMANPVPLMILGLLPLLWGIYRLFILPPKTFSSLDVTKQF